jgi:TonB family protein
MKVLHHRGLVRMIHEHFCCNRQSAAATGLRSAGTPLGPSPYCTSTYRGLRASRAGLATRLIDFATNRHKSCGLVLLAGICCVALFCPGFVEPAHSESSPQTTPSPGPTKRWTQFELSQAESMGDPQTGKSVTLTVFLGGVAAGMSPVVATSESIMFQTQTVTLEPDAESMALKGTVSLEPILMSRTSVPPRAARVQVTFSRSRQDRLEPFMRRVVYVTMGPLEPAKENSESPPVRLDESQSGDVILDEVQPAVEPVSTGALAEEDLVPFASPGEGKAYWQHVSHLISRSWARQIRGVRRTPSSETVKVRFKMFPNGRAQLIEIEKGSGAREVDEAGVYAVINAQPFLPFPSELEEGVVDVHVRMRTGSRGRSREVQSVGSRSTSKPDASVQPSKK